MILYTTTFSTPLGNFAAAVDDAGAVVATAFMSKRVQAHSQRETGATPADTVRLLRQRLRAGDGAECIADRERTAEVRQQVVAYARGERDHFDLQLDPIGSAFEKRVWAALRRIPFGETRTYADLAEDLQSAPRAVGGANARNPICLLVPCHRVIGKNGALTGFAFGIALKQRLLDHERRLAARRA